MKRIGAALMGLGALVGFGAGVWVAAGIDRAGLPWIVSVGLVKLIIVAALGLMAAGALLARAATRAEIAALPRQSGLNAPLAPPAPPEVARTDVKDRQRRL